jgi:hypothetical protein
MGRKVQSGLRAGIGVQASILCVILIHAHVSFPREPPLAAAEHLLASSGILLFAIGFAATALLRGFARRMAGLGAMGAGVGVYLLMTARHEPAAALVLAAGILLLAGATLLGNYLARQLPHPSPAASKENGKGRGP